MMSRTDVRAIDQPSAELGTNSCSIAVVYVSPSTSSSAQPYRRGTDAQSAADSAANSSTSALTPGCRRRKTFIITSSSKMTEVLDCSTPIGRPFSGTGSSAPETFFSTIGPSAPSAARVRPSAVTAAGSTRAS